MNRLVIAIFPDEGKAYEAARVVEDPADPADIGVRGLAIIVRHADGTVSEQKWTSRLSFRAPIGALVGALIGLAAGPLGSAIGFSTGGLLGLSRDLAKFGMEDSFISDVGAQLTPGKSAVVIEVEEEASARLEARLRELGATVLNSDLKSEEKRSDAP
ncbi:MAG: hypothetical protein JWN85_778 [Gammaproteobacteria bacterium]|nr:hypothetical protein [Gammaproteobacteria bacterium]